MVTEHPHLQDVMTGMAWVKTVAMKAEETTVTRDRVKYFASDPISPMIERICIKRDLCICSLSECIS